MNDLKNLMILDGIDKKNLIEASKYSDNFTIILLSNVVYDNNILNDLEYKEVFFYLDESLSNKDSISTISTILNIKQYYILDNNSDKDIDFIISNAHQITHGDIKADSLRKNVDILFKNDISQMVRWKLFKNRVAESSAIKRLQFSRATPAILSVLAEQEQKILDFRKEDYIRVSVDYMHTEYDGDKSNVVNFKVQCKNKFKPEHKEELLLTLNTLKDQNISHNIKDIKRSTEELKPFAPLTTARLQRSCFYLFDLDPARTMSICEELCNGIKIDGVPTKLITSPFTDSNYINNKTIDEMIDVLVKKYGVNEVLSSKRVFSSADKKTDNKTYKEAIRPLKFSAKYFPQRLKEKLPVMHFEVYKFIFYRTLATQMKDSIYDNSKLVIEVNDVELIATAHKQEFRGWEQLDGYRQRASEDDNIERKEIVFPKDLYIGQELKPVSVSDFESTDKNPPRYGRGRFLSILIEKNLCSVETAHQEIELMEKTGLVTQIQQMLHPNEIALYCDKLFKEYLPQLREQDNLKKFEESIKDVKSLDQDAQDIIDEYESIKNDFEVAIEYRASDDEPDEWMIEKAKNIAKFHGDILTDDNPMFHSKQMILSYISTKENDLEKIGKCPECKKEQVVEDDYAFKCIDKSCGFKLYKKGKDGKRGGIKGFFEIFKKEFPEESYKDIVAKLVKRGGKVYFSDFKKKNNELFAAYVVLKKNKDFNSWQLELSFPKSKKVKIDESLKVENIIGSLVKNTNTSKASASTEKKEVDNKIELRTYEKYIKDMELFTSSDVSITTLNVEFVNGNKTIQSVAKHINDNLTNKELRFRQYQNKELLMVLIVGEYLKEDFKDLGLENLLYDVDLKIELLMS